MNLFVNVFDDLSNNISTNLILIETYPIIIWFNENYKRIEGDSNEQDVLTYISIKDILSRLRGSTYYEALNVTMKRKISLNYIRDLFKTNDLFKDDYVESVDKIVNKVRIHKLNLLKNWELIVDNDSETQEFNDTVDNISTDNPLSVTNTTSTTTTTSNN